MNIFYPPYQERIFFFFFIIGMLLGVFNDLFRIKRRLLGANSLILFFDDVLYAVICSFTLLISFFIFNNGIVRWFEFAMCILGFIVYYYTLSRPFISVMYFVIDTLHKFLWFVIKPFTLLLLKITYPLFLTFKRKLLIKNMFCFIKSLSPLRK